MEVIRFQCPACKVSLTVPPSAAGFQGPCPKCAVQIIGPNPALGLEASLPETAAPSATREAATEPEATESSFPGSSAIDAAELIPPTDPFAGIAPAQEPTPQPPEPPAPEPFADPLPGPAGTPSSPQPAPSKPAAEEPSKPFTDFTPPTTTPAKPAAAAASAGSRGPSVTVLVLSCLLSAVTAFVVGYVLGQRSFQVAPPIFTTQAPAKKPAPQEPIPVPVRTYIPETVEPLEEAPRSAGPEATLKAFLDADGWAARSVYVMFPETVRPKMEARSQRLGDGPIETTEVSLFEVTSDAHIFMVSTPKLTGSFPVAVTRQEDNSWLIDWETFVEFHDDEFHQFAKGQGGDRGTFRLLVKPEPAADTPSLFESFSLTPPFPGRESRAFVAKKSVVRARLQGVFTDKAGFSTEAFDKLMSEKGIPLVLTLSYRENSSGQSYLQIEDVISVGWGPVEP